MFHALTHTHTKRQTETLDSIAVVVDVDEQQQKTLWQLNRDLCRTQSQLRHHKVFLNLLCEVLQRCVTSSRTTTGRREQTGW